MSLKRKQVKEGLDYPKKPRLTRSIAELIDEADRKDEDLYQGTISMRRSLPKEQADTPQLMDPSRSRRIFDREALREQLLKAKAKRIGTTGASAKIAPTPVAGERYEMQADYKEFIIEMEEANRAFLEYLQVVRNEVPIDTLQNLNVSNYPPLFTRVFFEKHPWREQLREFFGWFYSFPRDKTQPYNTLWEGLYEELKNQSDFNREYMEQTQQAMYMIAALFADHVLALNEGGGGGQPDDMPPLDDGSPLDMEEKKDQPTIDDYEFPVDYRIDPDDPREFTIDVDGTISEIAMEAFSAEGTLSDSQTEAVLRRPRGIPAQEVVDAFIMFTEILRLEIDRIRQEGIIVSERVVRSVDSIIKFLYRVTVWVTRNQKPSERALDRQRTQAEVVLADTHRIWLSIVAPDEGGLMPEEEVAEPTDTTELPNEEEQVVAEEQLQDTDVYDDMSTKISMGAPITKDDKKRWDSVILDPDNQPYDEQGLETLVDDLIGWMRDLQGITVNKDQVDTLADVAIYLNDRASRLSEASQEQIAKLVEALHAFTPSQVYKGYVKMQVKPSLGRPLQDLFTIYFNRGKPLSDQTVTALQATPHSDANVRRTLRLLMAVVERYDGKTMTPEQLKVVEQFADIVLPLAYSDDYPQETEDIALAFDQFYSNETTITADKRAPLRRIEL
jgi:hypothetical protein